MIALRWSLRLLGVVSTFILAHLLRPDDFGVVAMAMLFVGLMEALGDTGERLALLRLPAPRHEHYNTAWTMQLLVGVTVAAAIFLLAPLTGAYFHDPRSIVAMRCLAARPLLGGLENIGSVDFRRDLRFGSLFNLMVRAKAISFVITLILAIALRNYWALIFGIVAGQAAITLLSYAMHPYRPSLSWAGSKELFSFSAWTLIRTAALYLASQVDQFAVGGIASANIMGRYAVAADVAASPTAEINEPMVAVLYPVMSRVNGDPDHLRRLYLQVLAWSAVICAATGIGIAVVAADYAGVILGGNWNGLEPLIRWLALAAGLAGLSSGADTTLDALGLPQRSAYLHWIRFGFLGLCAMMAAFWLHSPTAVAAARMVVSLAFLPLLLWSTGRAVHASWRDYGAALWRPLVAGALMALAVMAINHLSPWTGLPRLLIAVPLGGLVYAGALIVLWHLSGRPEGPEKDIILATGSLRRSWGTTRAHARCVPLADAPDDGNDIVTIGDPL